MLLRQQDKPARDAHGSGLDRVEDAFLSRPHSVSATAFEFIPENSHITAVREFLQSLPDALSR